jgi:hypothetical protein
MIHSHCAVDKIDVVCLVAALMKANELEERLPEGEVYRVQVGEWGDFYLAAKKTLKLVKQLHREHPGDWDGVVWFELLNDASRGSLADLVVEMMIDTDVTKEDLRLVVIDWLKTIQL